MKTAALFHALYTNASGRRGRGFRHLDLGTSWPAADQRRLGRWLESLRPAPGDSGERFAVNSFRLGSTIYACLARVDADFARDEHGRGGGLLVHALVTPLDESRPPGDFTGALLTLCRGLVRPGGADTDRLDAYLEACRQVSELAMPATPGVVEADFLIRFCAFSCGPPRSREVLFDADTRSLADTLAAAASHLPPRLRLACRWAVGLSPTPEMTFVARTSRAGERLVPAPEGTGTAYARWVLDSPENPPKDSWDVRSWEGLLTYIHRR